MTLRFLKIFLATFGLGLLVACDGGGSIGRGSPYCPVDYDAEINVENNDEATLSSADLSGTNIYFVDHDRDIRIHVKTSGDTAEDQRLSIQCLGGRGFARLKEEGPIEKDIPVVSSVISDGTGKLFHTIAVVSIDIRQRSPSEPLLKIVVLPTDDVFEGPTQKPYESFPEMKQQTVLENGILKEVRTHYATVDENDKSSGILGAEVLSSVTYTNPRK